ncbi:ABC-2 family transporter permease [Mobiluncus mulieris]|uniref:lantibiotic ABC transporter permease n=1 Tax=Mobiluncus mulieris TaxID=2052 RepID=UPI00147010AD|nr:lantibiotic ABC transporter permease [Mobiluncus mulieris]MCU9971337.1 lantibiotic ABC transporter permease [Mobiluncus mulieris]NMW91983.1 lantibiotic ABC transporter permease [Mobiluncus mulieris]
MRGMKALGVELYKQRRTGLLTALLVVGWLGAGYAALLFGLRGSQLLALPLAPMDVLLTQLYGVLCVLNIFGIVVAACLAYYLEFSGNAIRKLCVLPLAGGQIFLWKFVIIAAGLLAPWVIQYAAIALVGLRYLPSGAFDVAALVAFAAYTFLATLPIVSLMLLVASRFTNIWVPLGVGVAGFLSGIALATAKSPIWLGHPFVAVFQPAITTTAVPNPLVIAIAIVETVLFGGLGLVLSQYKAYE